jgi:5-methylcytosine-specific restriction enzyme subunit McrC
VAKPIPVRNLYFMFCYAWDSFRHGEDLARGAVDAPDLQNLLASVLEQGVRRLLRRGLDHGYAERTAQLSALRGRIALGESLPLRARQASSLVCRFDERAPDVIHNRILKATLVRLATMPSLDPKLVAKLKSLIGLLRDVSVVPLTLAVFRQVQLYRHNAGYGFLLHICRLVMQVAIPEKDGTSTRFYDVANDEASMRLVFEAFVRNLLAREQCSLQVSRPRIKWDTGTEPATDLLPGMQVDMLLQGKGRTIILDTKYTVSFGQTYRERESLRSGHLYQLFSYLRNAVPTYGCAEGILLYPAVGEAAEYRATLQGHRVRVATVDLNQPWPCIKEALLSLVRDNEVGA